MSVEPFLRALGLNVRRASVKRDVSALVSSSSVAELLELVENGELEASDVIAAERAGKNRKTLLKALTP